MPPLKAKVQKQEQLAVFLPPRMMGKVDEDVGKLGNTRSEVIRNIVTQHYTNRKIIENHEARITELEKKLKERAPG